MIILDDVEFMDPMQHEQADSQPQVEIEVYSYGGCTTCGNSMWNWFRQQNLKVNHVNVQITYERQAATQRAIDAGIPQREVVFPLIFVGDKVYAGFKPTEILAEVNKIREGN